jgi:hypothetical protein
LTGEFVFANLFALFLYKGAKMLGLAGITTYPSSLPICSVSNQNLGVLTTAFVALSIFSNLPQANAAAPSNEPDPGVKLFGATHESPEVQALIKQICDRCYEACKNYMDMQEAFCFWSCATVAQAGEIPFTFQRDIAPALWKKISSLVTNQLLKRVFG